MLNSFICGHSKPIIEIINFESSCLKNKAARIYFFSQMDHIQYFSPSVSLNEGKRVYWKSGRKVAAVAFLVAKLA